MKSHHFALFRPLVTGSALLLLTVFALPGCGGSDQGNDPGSKPAEASSSATAKSTSSGERFALTTEIPPEVLAGTPMPINVDNIETAPSSAPSLQVPEGTILLSSGKPVTASDDFPIIGELDYITDGDKDGEEGYYVELMNGPQWVQIDLGASARIEAVWLWHYHSQMRAYHDVILQVSDDPNFETGVTTLYNNDYDNSYGLGRGNDRPYVESRFGKLIDGDGATGRYVRLHSNGNTSNDMNHYIEVEVYGQPLQ